MTNVELVNVKLVGKLTTGPYLVQIEEHTTAYRTAVFAVLFGLSEAFL